MNFSRHKDYHVIHRPLKFKSINVSLYSVFSKAFNRFLGVLSLGRIVFSFLSVLKAIRFTKARFCPATPVSYTHLRAHETRHDLVCRLLLEKKKKKKKNKQKYAPII